MPESYQKKKILLHFTTFDLNIAKMAQRFFGSSDTCFQFLEQISHSIGMKTMNSMRSFRNKKFSKFTSSYRKFTLHSPSDSGIRLRFILRYMTNSMNLPNSCLFQNLKFAHLFFWIFKMCLISMECSRNQIAKILNVKRSAWSDLINVIMDVSHLWRKMWLKLE